ncbi:uncharacterized protein [Montipora foliosa]|uniref:uncharacterized protein n=1 Tax=Montipora foliosa TaxID=591990 RepID=UPI0035F2050C
MMALMLCLWMTLANYAVTQNLRSQEDQRAIKSIEFEVYGNRSFKEAIEFPVYVKESSVTFIQIKATKEMEVTIPKDCHVNAYKHPSLGYPLINEYCTIRGNGVIPLPALDKAMRFAFVIRQFFGMSNQFLFLHCGIITCQANETNSTLPSSAFRCSKWGEAPDINAEKCPNKKEENMAIGPFLVWPEWLRRDLKTNRGAPNATRAKDMTTVNNTHQVQIRIFNSSAYRHEYKEIPVNVVSYRKVFVELKATRYKLVVFPSECYVSLSKSYNPVHSSVRHDLINENCEWQRDVYFQPTHNKALRFRFVIKQFVGVTGQRLYLHCNVTTCQRDDPPEPTVFNCFTHGEYCPDSKQELITKGPFVVWPVGTKQERDKLKRQTNKRARFFIPTGMQSFPGQGKKHTLYAHTNKALAAVGFLPLGMLIIAMIVVCYHITKMKREAQRLEALSKESDPGTRSWNPN